MTWGMTQAREERKREEWKKFYHPCFNINRIMKRWKNKTEECQTDLICISLVTHPVAHNEEDDKSEHWGHNNPSNDNHNGAAKKLGLHKMAPQVLRLCGEVDTADHPGGGQRGHLVIIDGQHTQVIVGTSRQVVYQDALTGRGYHSVNRRRRKKEALWLLT